MNAGPIVFDSSPLIALERVERLDIPALLFPRASIPPAVAFEVGPEITGLPWLVEQPLEREIGSEIERASLGSGETQAIALALESDARWIVLDDEPARRLARRLGLPAIGTAGLLLAAKRKDLIAAVRPILDDLIAAEFRLSPEVYSTILIEAGEGPEGTRGAPSP